MLKLLGVLAAMTSITGGEATGAAPIYLVAEPADEGVRFRVVGAPQSDLDASFSLEVSGGGNRSVHRSSASLRAGDTVTLSTVSLGGVRPGEWRAHLRVEPAGRAAYEQTKTSF
jgi:hypothetical protein